MNSFIYLIIFLILLFLIYLCIVLYQNYQIKYITQQSKIKLNNI
jgi:hypothetical protein